MSYDLLCYRSSTEVPDAEEAEAILEAEGENNVSSVEEDYRERIANALLQLNPRLERFQFDYAKLAALHETTEEEARKQWSHIELNSPEGDLSVQFIIYPNKVDISVPYWYGRSEADDLFSQLSEYLKTIKKASGLMVYDPQSGIAFDPDKQDLSEHSGYDKVVSDLPRIALEATKQISPKPWWKFW